MVPASFNKDSMPLPDLDDDLDEMMILGATPNFGSTPSDRFFNGPAPGGSKSASGAAANTSLFERQSMNPSVQGDADEIDDIMGMSPDLPSMIRSPNMASPGFENFLKQFQGSAGSNSLGTNSMGPPSWTNGPQLAAHMQK